MNQVIKNILSAIGILAIFVPLAFSVNLIRLDQSQLNNAIPIAVQASYKVYCNSNNLPSGYFIQASIASMVYTSGNLTTIIVSDAVSGVPGSHNFTTTYTYSGGSLSSTSCPQLTTSF